MWKIEHQMLHFRKQGIREILKCSWCIRKVDTMKILGYKYQKARCHENLEKQIEYRKRRYQENPPLQLEYNQRSY